MLQINFIVLNYVVFGAAGGCAGFLYALRLGHFRYDQYIRKFLLEITGATLTSTFLCVGLAGTEASIPLILPFGIGLIWANLIQGMRMRFTEAALSFLSKELEQAGKANKQIQSRGNGDHN